MAMERTTRIHTGKTPIPGMASAISPGSRAQRRPRIRNNTAAVPTSSAHCTGTAITVQNDKMSETAATAKAIASLVREGRFEGAIGSVDGRMIVLSACIALLRMMLLNIPRHDRAMAATESQPMQRSGSVLTCYFNPRGYESAALSLSSIDTVEQPRHSSHKAGREFGDGKVPCLQQRRSNPIFS